MTNIKAFHNEYCDVQYAADMTIHKGALSKHMIIQVTQPIFSDFGDRELQNTFLEMHIFACIHLDGSRSEPKNNLSAL